MIASESRIEWRETISPLEESDSRAECWSTGASTLRLVWVSRIFESDTPAAARPRNSGRSCAPTTRRKRGLSCLRTLNSACFSSQRLVAGASQLSEANLFIASALYRKGGGGDGYLYCIVNGHRAPTLSVLVLDHHQKSPPSQLHLHLRAFNQVSARSHSPFVPSAPKTPAGAALTAAASASHSPNALSSPR